MWILVFPAHTVDTLPQLGLGDELCYKVRTKFVWSQGCFGKDPPAEGIYSPLFLFFNLYFQACIIPSSPVMWLISGLGLFLRAGLLLFFVSEL